MWSGVIWCGPTYRGIPVTTSDDPECKYAHTPRSRRAYWIPKLKRNIERDRENLAKLKEMGWNTLVMWECQLEHMSDVSHTVTEVLGPSKWRASRE